MLIVFALCVVTFGLYPTFWYLRRARFLDSLSADKKVGLLPWVLLALDAALIVLSAVQADGAARVAQLGAGGASLFLGFRVAAILRSDFARTGRLLDLSGAGVFFFGCLYLQHVINEAAEKPARTRPPS